VDVGVEVAGGRVAVTVAGGRVAVSVDGALVAVLATVVAVGWGAASSSSPQPLQRTARDRHTIR
jgi:hypothetical protein